MAQARSEMPLPWKNRPKGPRQDRLPSQSNLRAHWCIYATCYSQTFCKSLILISFYKRVRSGNNHRRNKVGGVLLPRFRTSELACGKPSCSGVQSLTEHKNRGHCVAEYCHTIF